MLSMTSAPAISSLEHSLPLQETLLSQLEAPASEEILVCQVRSTGKTEDAVPPSAPRSEHFSDSSDIFREPEDPFADNLLPVHASNDPEVKVIEHEVVNSCEFTKSHKVPIAVRYQVHDSSYCKICQGQEGLHSTHSFAPLNHLKKCSQCLNCYPWYLEMCSYCEVRASLAQMQDSRYKQKLRHWCPS